MHDAPLKKFVVIFFLVALVSAAARIFIVVYAREVFLHSDGLVSLYSVFGGLGMFIIGLFIKFFVDRIGSKPLFVFCTAAGLASIVPILLFREASRGRIVTDVLFLSLLFFLMNFAFIGAENISQTYFVSLVPKELMVELSIVYYLVFGVAGSVGSFVSGVLLDGISAAGIARAASFKLLFALLFVLLAIALFLQRKLVSLGSLSIMDALEVLFSPRDLRAISLLDKLNKSSNEEEEEELLSELHDSPSFLAQEGLLERLKSPRFMIRLESLRALNALPEITAAAENALLDDIASNPYTTAYYSARILGDHNVESAMPLLQELVVSDDYMLAGEAMIALAKLGDRDYIKTIERVIVDTNNPRLKIMGVEALGIFKDVNSLPVLFEILLAQDPPPYLRDETVLSMSVILDIGPLYYRLLVQYLSDTSLVNALAEDEADAALEYCKATLKISGGGKSRSAKKSEKEKILNAAIELQMLVKKFMARNDGSAAGLSGWLIKFAGSGDTVTQAYILAEAVLEDEVSKYDRVRLLVVQWASRMLRQHAHKAAEHVRSDAERLALPVTEGFSSSAK
jgi:MFS family permease